jgi:hypothetical protein
MKTTHYILTPIGNSEQPGVATFGQVRLLDWGFLFIKK